MSKRYVSKEVATSIHAKAKPFITWLKEAESESEEDEVDVVYTNKPVAVVETKPVEEDEAFDIDDI